MAHFRNNASPKSLLIQMGTSTSELEIVVLIKKYNRGLLSTFKSFSQNSKIPEDFKILKEIMFVSELFETSLILIRKKLG